MAISLTNKLISAAGLSLLDQLLRVISAFVLSPLIISNLGMNNYGAWLLGLSIAGLLELADLGYTMAAVRFYASSFGAQNGAGFSSLFSWLKQRYLKLGAAMAGLGVLIVIWSRYFDIKNDGTPSVWLIVGTLAIAQGIAYTMRSFSTLLRARLAYGKLLGTGIVRLLLFSSIVLWLSLGGILDVWKLLTLHSCLLLIEAIVLFALSWPMRPLEPVPFDHPIQKERSDFRRFAHHSMLGGMIEMFRQRLDIQILGGFSTLTSVTQYGVGTRLPIQFFDFVNALFGGHLMTGLTQLLARGDNLRANDAVFRMVQLSAFVTVTGCTLITVFGESFLKCWLGPGYSPAASVMIWVTLAMGLENLHSPLFSLLGAKNAYDQVIYKSLVTSALNLIVSLCLVQWFGLMGVVWGTLLEYMLWGLILWPRVGAHQMDVSVSIYWWRIFGQSVAPSALAAIPISLMVSHWIAPDSFVKLAFSCLCVALPLSLVGWFLFFRKDERKWISDRFGFKSKPHTP